MVSIIIPAFNEEKTIVDCLESLSKQTYSSFEVIVVDDGSADKTFKVLSKFQIPNSKFQINIISQKHLGPGEARNLGAEKAKGEILVFIDADMTFDKDFIKNLVDPIIKEKSKGTFTREEYVANWNNVWARCWNYNEGIFNKSRIPESYPDTSPVFRAVLKSEFRKAKGFDDIGYTDDWTLSRKLGYQATLSKSAICYHRNPETLKEIYTQARWIGKNEFISGTLIRCLYNLIRYSLFIQMLKALFIVFKTGELKQILFQIIYSFGINISILINK